MDEKKVWEQPSDENVEIKVDENKEEKLEEKPTDNSTKEELGSQFGKFKDAESLLSAYNSLQAEFTKKCQKLSEYEKKSGENEQKTPIFEGTDWNDKVSDFVNSHTYAKKFASEISQELIDDPSISVLDNALDVAWGRVMSKNYKPAEEMIKDDKFIGDYVLNNEQIKQKVLEGYIQDLGANKIPPLVSASSGGDIAFATQKKATSLSEAKSLVEAIFNIKGK